jgi:hypothetical protein
MDEVLIADNVFAQFLMMIGMSICGMLGSGSMGVIV